MKKQVAQRNIFSRAPFAFKASEYFDSESVREERTVSEIPIFPVGSFKQHHDMPDGFEITPETIQGFVDTFDSGVVGSELPVYPGHGDGYSDRKAVGWVKSLINRGDKGLWGVVEWTQEGLGLIREKAFKYISPEWLFEYTDPRTGEAYKNVLFAPALVNEPYFQMPSITASNKSNITIYTSSMNTKELVLKEVSELSEEEKNYLREHKDEIEKEELDEEKRVELFKAIVIEDEAKEDEGGDEADDDSSDDEGADEEKKEDEDAGDDDTGDGDGETEKKEEGGDEAATAETVKPEAPATASIDKEVRITASQLARFKNESSELNKMKITASVEKSKVLPAIKDAVVEFALKLNEKMGKETSDEFIGLISKAKASIKTTRVTSAEEKGEKTYETAQDELTARATAHAETHKISLDKAITAIGQQDPALMKRVDAERAE